MPDGIEAVKARHFDLKRSGINGRAMATDRVDEVVTRGTAETWTVRNADGTPHMRGPKGPVFVPSGTTMKLAMRFDGPADPHTPYMYHCHLPHHEDQGMMGQFVVVEKGQQAGAATDPAESFAVPVPRGSELSAFMTTSRLPRELASAESPPRLQGREEKLQPRVRAVGGTPPHRPCRTRPGPARPLTPRLSSLPATDVDTRSLGWSEICCG
ncbi:hypothetical protein GCM10022384_63230 [Streptomyces marokkonensis]|uniref:Plastocyanin-like domain-containing protein n=1 Tax=Streptomyces marokkonensis TaxID=324855 RepID=A0ABP7SA62_9ACTN